MGSVPVLKRLLISTALTCLAASPAHAQIYSWTDGNGHLVLSDHPQGGAQVGYAVPQTSSFRTTRPVDESKSTLYDDIIRDSARQHSVRTDLVRAVVQVESGYNPFATSPKGALGLMQLMPATIQQFGVKNPFDPMENVRAGVAYLRRLLDKYADNEVLALAAYNAGPKAVDKYEKNVPPYAETRNYVRQIGQLTARPIEPRDSRIYKVTEIVNGRPVIRYTDKRPATGSFEIVAR